MIPDIMFPIQFIKLWKP